jgi:lysozyme family protein
MTLQETNAKRWTDCKVSAAKGPAFEKVANRLLASKDRYQKVEKLTGVPWHVIAVIHEREASQNWNTQLGQGDPLNKKSTHVPKGRGPFATWEDGAVDALTKCPPYAANNHDWSVGGTLALLEKYNGLGYYNKGVPSPYIWAGTNQYVKGKYVSDGVYDPNHVDTQLGCAGLLKFMGVFKKATVPVGTIVGAGTIGGLATTWNDFTDHWVLYSLGAAALALAIDVGVHLYRNRKTTNV